MSNHSTTRQELERSIRALLPEVGPLKVPGDDPATVATVGVGGLLTGYVWGWMRGRRSRSKRRR